VAAQELSVAYDRVSVCHGDTNSVPRGGGAYASRGTVLAGSSVLLAARGLKARILDEAARRLEVSAADLELRDGCVAVRGASGRDLALADLAASAPSPLSAEATFETDQMTYPYGVHVAEVEVDRGTGTLRLGRYLVAYDVGRAINPMLVEGQLVGGTAQGIGGSLLEQLDYDEAGQLRTASFMDYLLPTAMDMPPRVQVLLTEDAPSPLNPLGVKGAGEGGVVGASAAIANAVSDALGVEVRDLPLTPERVKAHAAR
jgi:carbon-monoxide dehydrogenase large subunit/6-hydroxypseudooxynicotine dehydrogenase subunit gamma